MRAAADDQHQTGEKAEDVSGSLHRLRSVSAAELGRYSTG
jgi:hypothetical protein